MIKDGGLSFKTQFKIEFLPPNNNFVFVISGFYWPILEFWIF